MAHHYTRKIPAQEHFNAFVSALSSNVSTAQVNGERSIYCHIPEDIFESVVQYCECHGWRVITSHSTNGLLFYKITGWSPIV